ncbi:monocarboxylate transporter 13-like isoform X3 [Eriocheir sinensis]|uniref:monocarboxylate transporter 13-like isoform X3 n=1 Tax=Eriocheir sinensis TaxID=95602 RepID=UPI0021C86DCF|nr:monocarboxylate transporter 13-like isoform X3 [Eriocheir sinensis]
MKNEKEIERIQMTADSGQANEAESEDTGNESKRNRDEKVLEREKEEKRMKDEKEIERIQVMADSGQVNEGESEEDTGDTNEKNRNEKVMGTEIEEKIMKNEKESESIQMTSDAWQVNESEDAGDDDEDRYEGVIQRSRAPDGGWGWVVALGSSIVTTLLFSVPFSFGILFSGYLLSVAASATATAWVYNLFLVVLNSSMSLANALGQEFGRRTVGFACVFMCSVSAVLSAFSPSVYFLYFSFSLVTGLGTGVGIATAYIVLPPYFDKKSGKANILLTTGAPVSQMVFAPLLRLLLELYSYRGAALIYSGVLLNGLIGMASFHPVKWHLKPPCEDATRPPQDAVQPLMTQKKNPPTAVTTAAARHSSHSPPATPSTPVNPSLRGLRRLSHGSLASVMTAASADVPIGLAMLGLEREASTGQSQPGCAKTLWRTLRRVARTTKSDMGVARHLRALILAGTFALTQTTHYNFVMLLPFAVRAADHSLQDAAWCISLLGVANFVVRLVVSPLADCKRFSIRASLMAGYCLKAVAAIVALFADELWLFAASAVLFGVGIGASVTLSNLSIIKYMGIDLLAQTFGFEGLVNSLCVLVIGPLLGVIRDVSGNYAASLWVMASLDLLSAGLWILMPAAQARDARR